MLQFAPTLELPNFITIHSTLQHGFTDHQSRDEATLNNPEQPGFNAEHVKQITATRATTQGRNSPITFHSFLQR
jgi:hypothetical protein